MVEMVFRRMASSPTPSKLGELPLVHFPSFPMDPAGAIPALDPHRNQQMAGGKVPTISTRLLYNHETKRFVHNSYRVLVSLATHKHPPTNKRKKWVVGIRVIP